jgi:hypothetical protein
MDPLILEIFNEKKKIIQPFFKISKRRDINDIS